jgi:hypothetical protein
MRHSTLIITMEYPALQHYGSGFNCALLRYVSRIKLAESIFSCRPSPLPPTYRMKFFDVALLPEEIHTVIETDFGEDLTSVRKLYSPWVALFFTPKASYLFFVRTSVFPPGLLIHRLNREIRDRNKQFRNLLTSGAHRPFLRCDFQGFDATVQ